MLTISPEAMPARVIESWEELESRNNNQFVEVHYPVLDHLAQQNPTIDQPTWRIHGIYPENDWAFAAQTIVTNTINYMFLNRDIARDGEGWAVNDSSSSKPVSGSSALSMRINQFFGESEDITAERIEDLAIEQIFDELFPAIPMAESRRRQLLQFADGLRSGYGSSVRALIESTADDTGNLRVFNSGDGMVERLLSDDFGDTFTDTDVIDELVFPHNKRANLTPILIDGRARDSHVLPPFTDIDKSGAVPDYRLPQALRSMGAIAYSRALADVVDTWTPIEKGSRQEAEIRGATARAAFYLLGATNEVRVAAGEAPYTMAHLDYWLWSMGREVKKNHPNSLPHYTETTAY